MDSKCEKALQTFRSGYNCAQSVLSAFVEDDAADGWTAMQMSMGFGAGMGRLQKTCGAVTGAFMVLGLYAAKKEAEKAAQKILVTDMIREFHRRFENQFQTTDCAGLLKCDLNTEEGQDHAREHRLFETVCENCVTGSVMIVEEMTECP